MYDGISKERLVAMSDTERRWLENVKKAFHESDLAYSAGQPESRCMEELCKAVDTAKTLRRSLRGESTDTSNNKARFIEFLELDIPAPSKNGLEVALLDARTRKPVSYSFAGLIYAIRCMIHENENLNAAERPDYHIQLDWRVRTRVGSMGVIRDGRLICNGHKIWYRLRELLAKFIMGLEASISLAEGKGFATVSVDPPLGSIRPYETTQVRQAHR